MIFDEMRAATVGMCDAIHNHPFNIELADGTLSKDKFFYYLRQDALYLADFGRALALTAVRLPEAKHQAQFMQFVNEAIDAENSLHRHYLKQVSSGETQKMPACFMYTQYLLATASLATVEEAVASLLPCFWIYAEVGKKMQARANHMENPYRDWIALYSGEAFDVSVTAAIEIVNALGERTTDEIRQKMVEAFLTATRLEWLFWEAAYKMEQWKMIGEKNESARYTQPFQSKETV